MRDLSYITRADGVPMFTPTGSCAIMAHSKSPWKSSDTDYDLMVNLFQFDRTGFLSTCKEHYIDLGESNYNLAISVTMPFKDNLGGGVVSGPKTNIIPLADWELAKWMFATTTMANPVYGETFCTKSRRVATFESLRGVYGAQSVMSGKEDGFDPVEENVRSRLIWESLPEAVFSEFYGRACVATDVVYRRPVIPTIPNPISAAAGPMVPVCPEFAAVPTKTAIVRSTDFETDDNIPY